MKISGIKLILMFVVMLAINNTYAQTERKNRNSDKNNTEKLDKELSDLSSLLSLSDAQKSEFKVLLAAHHKDVKAIRDANKNDEEKAKAAMKPLKKEFDTKLMALMTDEQKEKFKEYKKQRRNNKPKR